MNNTIKIAGRFLRPGTKVLIGPEDDRFFGRITDSTITEYSDHTNMVKYDVEWWNERVRYHEVFSDEDVEVVE